jgi:putative oxidoreductase
MFISETHSLPASFLTDRVATLFDRLDRIPTSVLALFFRVAVAFVFWRSGMSKIASWDATVALFDMEYMLPFVPAELGAYMATAIELTCPLLLILGLATRPAAAVLLGMTLVIQLFVYPENWPDHILWGSILAYLVARGAGAVSLDHLIARAVGRRSMPASARA